MPESLWERAKEALRACESNLRLIHEAAGPVPKSAPMPTDSTFGAWRKAASVLAEMERVECVDALWAGNNEWEAPWHEGRPGPALLLLLPTTEAPE